MEFRISGSPLAGGQIRSYNESHSFLDVLNLVDVLIQAMAGVRVRWSRDPNVNSREPTMGTYSIVLIAVAVIVLVVALVMKKKA